ncbi:DJ-1/PfpI family protein [Shigella flexneri]
MITIEKQAGKTVKRQGEASATIHKSIDEVTPAGFDALLLPGRLFTGLSAWGQPFVTFTRDFATVANRCLPSVTALSCLISADVIRVQLTAVKPIIIDVKMRARKFYDQEVVVDKDEPVTSRTPRHLPSV